MTTNGPAEQRYLVLQHRQWWARFRVPADVRSAFESKSERWVNLQTNDHKTAVARCYRAASDFRARVLEARGRTGAVEEDALMWRRNVVEAQNSAAERPAVDAAIRAASELYVRGGHKVVARAADLFHDGSEGEALLDLGGPKAETFVAIALQGRKPLSPFVQPWHTVRLTEVEAKTAAMDKTAVNRFAEAFPLATSVTKAAVADWIEQRKVDVSAATVQREVTGIRSFWGYLRTREEVPDVDPFASQKFKDRRKDVQRGKRIGFSALEVAALYAAATKADDQQLADLIAMAAYTGCRREELCGLKVEDVVKGWIAVKDAKTAAGNRGVPVHAALLPTLKRLIGTRTAGYVLGDTGMDQWGKRGDALGKRFTRLKGPKGSSCPNGLGFGREKTFHSIRHSFVSLLRAKGVPKDHIADLVGHKQQGTTLVDYADDGSSRKLLPGSLAKLRYPKPL